MKFKKYLIIFALISSAIISAAFSAKAIAASNIPAGCPGGPSGPKAPGVVCPPTNKFCGTLSEADCQKILNTVPTKENPLGGIGELLNTIVNWVTGIFIIGVVLIITISGVQMAASSGNPDVIKSAKKNIFNAILGLALLISTRAFFSIFGIYDTGFSPPTTLFSKVDTSSYTGLEQVLINAITIAVSIAGVVSVIFVIIGGVRYILSAGSPDAVKNAKNTILYALVGLIISIFAYGIVSFVINRIQ